MEPNYTEGSPIYLLELASVFGSALQHASGRGLAPVAASALFCLVSDALL